MLVRIIHAAIVFEFTGYSSGYLKNYRKHAAIFEMLNSPDYSLLQGAIE